MPAGAIYIDRELAASDDIVVPIPRTTTDRYSESKEKRAKQSSRKDHPPAAAGGAAAAAVNAGCWWQPVVSQGALLRAHIAMAAAAAAFALFALTLQPATFPHLPAYCDTTARDIMQLRFRAWLLLLCAMAQAGAATAALVVPPQSRAGVFFAVVTNLLGLLTVGHLWRLVIRTIFATGGLCITSHLRTAELIVHAVLAHVFAIAIPVLWAFGQ